jgi:hypothetical protein
MLWIVEKVFIVAATVLWLEVAPFVLLVVLLRHLSKRKK